MSDRTIRTVADLVGAGLAAPKDAGALEAVTQRYALAITPAVARLIDRSDPHDPIARQYVPDPAELESVPVEMADPIGDRRHMPVEGIVHRYRNRVLLKLLHTCPVYCRFCFRREMVGPAAGGSLDAGEVDAALDWIASQPGISEVIMTGGDPLMLSPRRIESVTSRLAAIPHVGVLRWHSRVPVADPDRITPELVAALKAPRVATYVAVHANHARELNGAACDAIARLADAGIPLLGQSVLLAGVNDTVDALAGLMDAFIRNRIKPYYLHHADLAPGTSHFRTTIAHGQDLMMQLRQRVSGIAVPAYVLDIPGGYAKANLEPARVRNNPDGSLAVMDDEGTWHAYPTG